jgi:hypothetical protein
MMLEQITGFTELVGAVGVILSLLYVGKQLKQTNTMSRSAARQSMSAQMNDWGMAIAASPSLAETFSKVHFRNLVREGATELERIQVAYALLGIVGQIHFAYEQQKEGILTQEELDGLHGPGGALFRQPYLASLWPILCLTYPQDFRRWFERRFNLNASDESGEVHG